jgi:hypothetical protein
MNLFEPKSNIPIHYDTTSASTPQPEDTRKYTLDTKQCASIAMYMYEQWQEAMKPPLFAYYDFPTWLQSLTKEEDKAHNTERNVT